MGGRDKNFEDPMKSDQDIRKTRYWRRRFSKTHPLYTKLYIILLSSLSIRSIMIQYSYIQLIYTIYYTYIQPIYMIYYYYINYIIWSSTDYLYDLSILYIALSMVYSSYVQLIYVIYNRTCSLFVWSIFLIDSIFIWSINLIYSLFILSIIRMYSIYQ